MIRLAPLAPLCMLLMLPLSASAQPLETALSANSVILNAQFSGDSITVFGAVPSFPNIPNIPNNLKPHVVIVLHGPPKPRVVRLKKRAFGVPVYQSSVFFPNAPSYFAVAASPNASIPNNPLDLLKPPLQHPQRLPFQNALLQHLRSKNLAPISTVQLPGKTLFHSQFPIPPNASPGLYHARVSVILNQQTVLSSHHPLYVKASGSVALASQLAHNHPWLHGFLAVLIAALAGLFAEAAFRGARRRARR